MDSSDAILKEVDPKLPHQHLEHDKRPSVIDTRGNLESKTLLQAIFNGTYEFIGLLTPEGKVLESNRASLEWIGAKREEVVGRPLWETPWWTYTPGAVTQLRSAIEVAAKGDFVRQEVTLKNKDGDFRTFDFSIYPVRDESNHVVLLVPEGRDISERKQAEEKLGRLYTDNLKLTAMNRALVGAFEFDQVTDVVCRAARDFTGADGSTFVLREGNRVRYTAENAVAPLWKGSDFPIDCCISGWAMLNNEPAIVEDIYADTRIPHDAYRSTFVKSLVMVPVGPGMPVASIGVYWSKNHQASEYEVGLLQSIASVADIALAGVRAYEETRQAWTHAEQANRLKDIFLATLSHELRNPLNNIVGFSEVLLRNPEVKQSQPIAQAAECINRNGKVQAQLINDLLDLSRLHTGKLKVERKPIIFNSIVRDLLESVRREMTEKHIAFESEIVSEPLPLNGDIVRLQQIVWNLICNAMKFTPSGGRVRVSLQRIESTAKLIVEDSGIGIAPEFLPHVFEMFRQADAGTTRRHGGMGIGLALVKQLTEMHDGVLEADSKGSGRGARFTVTLPLDYATVNTQAKANSHANGDLRGARVLIVDDTQDSLDMLEALLMGEGAIVRSAISGKDALELAKSTHFDLLVSDISMPGMDGYELLRTLRSEMPRYKEVPAIALTGFGRKEDMEHALRVGFENHLTKPLEFDTFLQLANTLLRRPV